MSRPGTGPIRPARAPGREPARGPGGFTAPELLIASVVLLLVLGAALAMYNAQERSWRATSLQMETDHAVNMVIQRLVYGQGGRRGLRAAQSAAWTGTENDWTLTYVAGGTNVHTIRYQAALSNLVAHPGPVVVGENIALARAAVQPVLGTVALTVRVDRVRGPFQASREAGTVVRMRN